MKQPKGFEEYGDKHLVCKLSKTLYMFHKAFWAWYEKIDHFFINLIMTKSGVDFNHYFWHHDKKILIVMFYVDDHHRQHWKKDGLVQDLVKREIEDDRFGVG
jgi:hypothetical protein